MKHINFKKIRMQHFLSFGEPVEVTFQNGVTFVTGFNYDKNSYNGVGKTALIIEALSFVLFGETYRDIVVAKIANWESKETCAVEVWLDINGTEYYISRSLNPSCLIFEEDGKPIQKTIPQTNKDIIAKLGIAKDIFTNLIVMTNDTSVAFLRQKSSAIKTKFIEGLLSLEVYAKMFEHAKEKFKVKDKEVDVAIVRVTEINKALDNDHHYHQLEEGSRNNAVMKFQKQIDEIRNAPEVDYTENIRTTKSVLEIANTTLNELLEKCTKFQIKKSEIDSKILQFSQEEIKWNSIRLDCPTCKRPFEEHNRDEIAQHKSEIRAEKEKYEVANKKLSGLTDELDKNIREIRTSITRGLDTLKEYEIEQRKWEQNQNQIAALETMLVETNMRPNPFAQKIVEGQANLNVKQIELEQLQHDLKILDVAKSSTNLIKAYVIKRIISIFNNRINYYLSRLDAPVRIIFDEFFEERIVTTNGLEISYGNLSSGEQKRVDFSMLFAFRDIRRLQSGVSVNITVFDELFDSSIDRTAMDNILSLLEEFSEKEGYYIISHRITSNDFDGKFNMIVLEKRNGITVKKL